MAIYKRNSVPALAEATSANGTARDGTTLALERVAVGSLVIEVTFNITTSSVVGSHKIQVSMDASEWFDFSTTNGAAPVSTAAGTGSPVVTQRALPIPDCVHSYRYLRVVLTLSGASTATADVSAANYRFVEPGGLEGVR